MISTESNKFSLIELFTCPSTSRLFFPCLGLLIFFPLPLHSEIAGEIGAGTNYLWRGTTQTDRGQSRTFGYSIQLNYTYLIKNELSLTLHLGSQKNAAIDDYPEQRVEDHSAPLEWKNIFFIVFNVRKSKRELPFDADLRAQEGDTAGQASLFCHPRHFVDIFVGLGSLLCNAAHRV